MTIHRAENVAQNTHNQGGSAAEMGSVHFVHDFGRVKTLLAELVSAGVLLRIEGDRLAFDAPAKVMTPELIGRMISDRDGLLAIVAGRVRDDVGGPGDVGGNGVRDDDGGRAGDGGRGDAGGTGDRGDDGGRDPDPVSTMRCPYCAGIDLIDDHDGLRCGSCRSLGWIATAEGGLARCGVGGSVSELVDTDSTPVCPACGRWCDVMTAADSWRCSRCDPDADERRRRTVRVLSLASRSRGRSVPSVRRDK